MVKKKVGLILGRFQPLHLGHIKVIEMALKENDELIICIGSAQKAEPLTIKERHKRISKQMKALKAKNYKIVDLIDPEPMSIWVSYVAKKCKITKDTKNIYYHGDQPLPSDYRRQLKELNFTIKKVPKSEFWYYGPSKVYHKFSSATEIKALHRRLKKRL